MKKIIFGALCASVLLASCGGSENSGSKEVPFTEAGMLSLIKTPEGQPITLEEYEALFLNYAKAEIDPKTLDLKNNAVDSALRTLSNRKCKLPSTTDEFRTKMLSNAAPQVRGKVMEKFGGLFGESGDNVKKVVAVLKDEKDPYVIKKGIRAISNELRKAPEAANYVIAQSKSDNPEVRRVAAVSLANSWSKGVDGVVDAVRALMNDPDKTVRGVALRGAGELEDESLIDDLEKVLNDPAQEASHGDAMSGIYGFWYDYPFHKHTSKKAYDVAYNYLSKKPRTDKVPYWTSIGELSNRAESSIDAWKSMATFYKDSEWVKLMADLAADPNVNWLGRTAAVRVIAKIGTKNDLTKLQKTVEGLQNDSKQKFVLDEITKSLK